ncbi:hypothetical protein STEG23_022740, partial [Scotinomys teguina]
EIAARSLKRRLFLYAQSKQPPQKASSLQGSLDKSLIGSTGLSVVPVRMAPEGRRWLLLTDKAEHTLASKSGNPIGQTHYSVEFSC